MIYGQFSENGKSPLEPNSEPERETKEEVNHNNSTGDVNKDDDDKPNDVQQEKVDKEKAPKSASVSPARSIYTFFSSHCGKWRQR